MIALRQSFTFDRVLTFFTLLLVRVITILFLAAGTVSGLVSFVAEYEVISRIFLQHGFLSGTTFAMLVAGVLECSKVFMTFVDRAYTTSKNAAYKPLGSYFKTARYALTMISAASMFIYAATNLASPNYDKEVAAARAELQQAHDVRVRQIDSSYTVRKHDMFAIDRADIEMWESATRFQMGNIVGKTWQGREFLGNKARLDSARAKQARNQSNLEIARLQEVAQVDSNYRRAIDRAKDSLRTAPSAHNQVIAAPIQIITGSINYSYRSYSVVVMVLSVVMSFALESSIWALANILAINFGDTFVMELEFGSKAQQYASAGRTLNDVYVADTEAFKERVVRYKKSILDTIKGLVDRARR